MSAKRKYSRRLTKSLKKHSMKKNEAAFQTRFKKRLATFPPAGDSVYELKYVSSGKFSLSQWVAKQPHQLSALLDASKHTKFQCYHKLSDQSQDKKPFDCFCLKKCDAYLVVYFAEQKKFVQIEATKIHALIKKQKSASFDELSEIAEFVDGLA